MDFAGYILAVVSMSITVISLWGLVVSKVFFPNIKESRLYNRVIFPIVLFIGIYIGLVAIGLLFFT